MTRFITNARVEATASINITECELRALAALTSYDDEAFLKFFYGNLGTTYLKPHEAGLRSFFAAIRLESPQVLKAIDTARRSFEGKP